MKGKFTQLMALIGDVGGFNSAIILIPTYLMSYFSFVMYKWAVTNEMPVKKREHAASHRNPLQAKLCYNRDQTLTQRDVDCLSQEV